MLDSDLLSGARAIVGDRHVLVDPASLRTYAYDAFGVIGDPSAVIFPGTSAEAAALVRLLHSAGHPFLARGSGTGYAGACVATKGEALIATRRLDRIRAIDVRDRTVEADAGVVTGDLQNAVARHGLYYPPDPSSLKICTIGGNVATNAGGAHCLGYGVTSNYVVEIEYVSPGGELERVRTGASDRLDVRGVIVGGESSLGMITGVTLRLLPRPGHIWTVFAEFERRDEAVAALCELFERGIKPIALDMTSNVIHPAGAPMPFPNPCVLYMELHGHEAEVGFQAEMLGGVVERHRGRWESQSKSDLMKRRFEVTQTRWRGIADTFGLPNYFLFDAVVKRSDLDAMMTCIEDEARCSGLIVANTFHAGDGNIHPTPFYDPREPGIWERLASFRDRICGHVQSLGGALSGEHGIGLEKTHLMPDFFGSTALSAMTGLYKVLRASPDQPDAKLLPPLTEGPKIVRRPELHRPQIAFTDGYAIFDAGTGWEQVRAQLAGCPYELPYDPIGDFEALPIGDSVLEGAVALRELRYGSPRDLLLGGVLVTRSGAEIEFGSVFAKDVSGFDLRKLVFGSHGWLGRLKTVAMKLEPRRARRLILRFGTDEDMGVDRVLAKLAPHEALASAKWVMHRNGAAEIGAILEADVADLDGLAAEFGPDATLQPWCGSANRALGLDSDTRFEIVSRSAVEAPLAARDGPVIEFFHPGRLLVPAAAASGSRPRLLSARDREIVEIFDDL